MTPALATPAVRVLLIEDSISDAKLVLQALRAQLPGLESERVDDAEALRAALLRADWDVVISDWSLPGFGALAALAIVTETGLDLPFIIVSGTIGEEAAVEAMRAGARDYVQKGKLARLVPVVERELGERAVRAARRRAEDEARRQETRFRSLIENSADAITITGADGALVYVSPSLVRMLGIPAAELVGAPGTRFIHPDDRARIGAVMATIREPDAAGLTVQFRALRADGACLWLEATATNLLAEPAVGGIVGNVRNITAQKRALDQLRVSELRFARLSESGIVGVAVTDLDGAISEANDAYLEIVGYSRDDLLSGTLRWSELTAPELRAGDQAAVHQLRTSGVARPWEKEVIRKDGSRASVLVGVALLADTTCVSFMADLTERRRAERALRESEQQLRQAQKMEAIGRLAGGIAHDFNNVLTVIISYAQLILGDLAADSALYGDLDEIRKAGQRAAELTRQLLIFSRQQVVETRILDLDAVLTSMDKMLRRLLPENIELVASPSSAGAVRADPGSIEQVIMNLVLNARDAMPTGGAITMETANIELDADYAATHHGVAPGAYVMLAVSDTGIGMDEATQARIFEPFFTTKAVGLGTGLGLSTVFGIVQQSGGHVWVYSEPGRGTTFKVYLPRVDAVVQVASSAPAPVALRGWETVLLVEDDDAVRTVAGGILRKHGYQVIEARHGGEALLASETAAAIHLLLTDVMMPQMSGPELARRLRAQRPELKVLCMSGYTDDAALRNGVAELRIAYLQKPLTVEALTRKVREVLDAPRPR